MKKIPVVFIIVFLILCLILIKNTIFKIVLQNTIKAVSGLEMSISTIDIGFIKTAINVKDLTIFNSINFPDRIMFEVPSLYVEYDIASLLNKELHIKDMFFELKQLNVIKNKDGALNLNSLNIIKFKKGRSKKPIPAIRIDKLHLKVGKVLYKDYAQTPSPKVLEFDVNLDEKYENIRNPYALGSLIVSRSLFKTNVSRLAGFDLGPLQEELKEVVIKGAEVIKKTQKAAVDFSKEVTKEAAKTLKETKEALKEIISLPHMEDERK